MDRNMMLTPDEYMSLMRLITSERESEGAKLADRMDDDNQDKPKRQPTKYQRTYKREFDKIADNYKLKSGRWAKGGFRRAVREAHRLTKKVLK